MNTRRNKRENRGNSPTPSNEGIMEEGIISDNEILTLISPLSDHSEDNGPATKNEKQTIPAAETAGASGAQEKVSQADRDTRVINTSPIREQNNPQRAPPSPKPGTSKQRQTPSPKAETQKHQNKEDRLGPLGKVYDNDSYLAYHNRVTNKFPVVKIAREYTGRMMQLSSEFHRTYGSYAFNSNLVKGGVEVRFTVIDDLKKYTSFLEAKNITYCFLNNYFTRKFVIRGIPADAGEEAVHSELENKGITVDVVTQMNSPTGVRYPLYLVGIPEGPSVEKFKTLEELGFFKITIEDYRIRRGPPQCTRCQRYYHSAEVCTNAPACRNCAGPHFLRHCKHPRDSEPLCVNCKGAHQANSAMCPLFVEAQKRRDRRRAEEAVLAQVQTAKGPALNSRQQIVKMHKIAQSRNGRGYVKNTTKHPSKVTMKQQTIILMHANPCNKCKMRQTVSKIEKPTLQH